MAGYSPHGIQEFFVKSEKKQKNLPFTGARYLQTIPKAMIFPLSLYLPRFFTSLPILYASGPYAIFQAISYAT